MLLTITINMDTEAIQKDPQQEIAKILQSLSYDVAKYDTLDFIEKGGEFRTRDTDGTLCGIMHKIIISKPNIVQHNKNKINKEK